MKTTRKPEPFVTDIIHLARLPAGTKITHAKARALLDAELKRQDREFDMIFAPRPLTGIRRTAVSP